MKVHTFTAISEKGMNKKINDFLLNVTDEVIDIKFSASIFYLSALVLLKDKEI
ncbi:hypothetical protein BU055_01895 [Staphylococcus succinus]|uniref:sporulation protein Cse60 n=1 Tax=Staphylococcus succinus TaxID=61015 RepID=UPI000D1D9F45|nr:sporulation protein Cse60 [Staphylococcus succinus]PTJ85064.1 hypothetical protein BU055_01895 [Staphylococcus succinus]